MPVITHAACIFRNYAYVLHWSHPLALSMRVAMPLRLSEASVTTEWMHSSWPPASWVDMEEWAAGGACMAASAGAVHEGCWLS